MKTQPNQIQEEVFRNKELMSYNVALTLNEQTDLDAKLDALDNLLQADKACDNPGNNAGDIQKFLGMKPDWDFGDNTAKAVAEYLGYENISTETDLWRHMVKEWPKEFKGGIAEDAQEVIGRLLSERCKELKKEQKEEEERELKYTLHQYMVDDLNEFLREKTRKSGENLKKWLTMR